ncbi:MAG: hypothetical protein E7345_03685 [Clostridiales bacterium]|nr:hypothetical protein [Clostridiales bacterium]
MNYYIDFDSTLYNTSELVNKMLSALATAINKQNPNLKAEDMLPEEKALFNSKGIYNIFRLCEFFADKYSLDASLLIDAVNNSINNGQDLVYPDTIEFLLRLRESGHNINMLTYTAKESIDYQVQKVKGSGLVEYFDNIIITSTPKWQLDFNYSNGIFIDDNPKDLAGLYSKSPIAVIRIKRDNNKYSDKPMPDDIVIPEHSTFSTINLEILERLI